MTWWIWMLFGLALLAVEILVPGGIIFLFFGASALVVGALVAAGLGGPLWLQAVVFSIMSVISLLTMRGPILRRMQAGGGVADKIDSFVGEAVVLTEGIGPRGKGKGELRGTSWTVVNLGESALACGDTRTVERVDGLTLFVR